MAYTALYRKWRPTRFEEVRGQDPIVRTLRTQINSDRIGHAYLFCGTRGTGKTSVAKIFARAVNCEHPVNGSPCNECPTCRAALSGASVNVVEIDAASNNGVENIREIREEVKYKPTEGKYRVYIIDEVHMLSAGAFNALLKTLEEPPEYVIFILATTEVQKIPVTVLSRCQRYDFKRLSLQELEDQIRTLLREEKVEAEDAAVTYIARAADGSSRDGLSLLEQCVSYYYGEPLTYERVLDVLGAVDQEVYSRFLNGIIDCDIAGCMDIIDGLLSAGRDIGQFVPDFIWYLRNVMLIQTENPGEEVLGISRANLLRMQEEAQRTDLNQIMRYIRLLSELSNQMRFSGSKRVLLEVTVLKMMQPDTETNLESLIDRVRYLEEFVASGKMETHIGEESAPLKAKQPQQTIEVPAAMYDDYQMVLKDWASLVSGEQGLFRSLYHGAEVSALPDRLEFLIRDRFIYTVQENNDSEKRLAEVLKNRYGKEFQISVRLLEENEQAPKIVSGPRIPGIEMDIEEEQGE